MNNQLERTNQALGLELEAVKAEKARLRAAVAELNERLHERTQGFLRRAAEDRREIGRLDEQMDACEMAAAGYLWKAVLLLEEESPWQMPGWWLRLKDVIFQLKRLGVHEGRMDGVVEMIKRLPGVEVDDELDFRQGDATAAAPPEGGTPAA